MCGISGLFHYGTNAGEAAPETLRRMCAALSHRGPDGEGTWTSPDRRVGLGHTRLAIIEPGPSAAQPMSNEDDTVRVTFNGEIYNHAQLRPVLAGRGHHFRTDHADTEVIVHAYEEWGAQCADRLDGEFAFAVADDVRGCLLLVRDRLGVKPLYFTLRPGLLIFASEIKGLLCHPAVTPTLSHAALYHYLTFLTTPAPLTMFADIFKLPAGCMLTIDRHGHIVTSRYWDALPPGGAVHRELESLSDSAQEDFCVRGVRVRLERAIEARMMSDVPLGVLLSGGLDSSIIVALMSQYMSGRVRTFTVGYSDHVYPNEFEHARKVASLFGTEHHEVRINQAQALDYLPALTDPQEEPMADWVCIPLYFVSRLARETGTAVVQTGEGSDEQFCGYAHYRRYLDLHRLHRRFRRLPRPVQRSIAALADVGSRLANRGSFYADAIDRATRDREVFWGGAIAFWERDKDRLIQHQHFSAPSIELPDCLRSLAPLSFLRPDSFEIVAAYAHQIERAFPSADFLTRMAYLECKLRLPELLLMRADKITMSASVEARVPFLDHRLVEFVMGIPASLKVKNGVPKYLLKRATDGALPDDVIHRPKMGFNAPMREWLRSDFGARIETTIMRSKLRGESLLNYESIQQVFARHRHGQDCSLQLWTIYNLTAWFDRWIAGRESA